MAKKKTLPGLAGKHLTVSELVPEGGRRIASHPWQAVLTGSRAYGKPRADSDIDLVVLLPRADVQRLLLRADEDGGKDSSSLGDAARDSAPFSRSMRFGNLNLICCSTVESFRCWKDGTAYLKAKADRTGQPVTRDDAVAYFTELRKARLGSPKK